MSPLEAVMLVCFGAAWPFSIRRSVSSKSTKGKSLFFMAVLLVGYAAGIANKLVNGYDVVLWLYVLNFVMVGADACLWLHYRRKEKQAERQPA